MKDWGYPRERHHPMNLVLNLSREAIRRADTTVPAPKVTWVRGTMRCQHFVKVDGANYKIAKIGACWYLYKFDRVASKVVGCEVWNMVRHPQGGPNAMLALGSTVATAKANAAMHLVRGAHPQRSDWKFDV